MAVKANQPSLHMELQDAFAQAPAPKLRPSRRTTTFEKGHGRYDQRTVQGLPARDYFTAFAQFPVLSHSAIFPSVVSAMFAIASLVKNAW